MLWSNMGISLLGIVAGAGLIAYGAGQTTALVAIVSAAEELRSPDDIVMTLRTRARRLAR